jgi:hypothetical protein
MSSNDDMHKTTSSIRTSVFKIPVRACVRYFFVGASPSLSAVVCVSCCSSLRGGGAFLWSPPFFCGPLQQHNNESHIEAVTAVAGAYCCATNCIAYSHAYAIITRWVSFILMKHLAHQLLQAGEASLLYVMVLG